MRNGFDLRSNIKCIAGDFYVDVDDSVRAHKRFIALWHGSNIENNKIPPVNKINSPILQSEAKTQKKI